MESYSEYRPSALRWLKEIPSHWKEVRYGAIFNLKPFKDHKDEDELLSVFLDRGVIKASESDKRTHNPSENLSKYQLVEPGDFVMNNQQAWRGSVGVSTLRGIISPAYHIFRVPNELNPNFANYLLRDGNMVSQFEMASRGVGSIQRTLNFNWLNSSIVIIPPLAEQEKIVSFINDKSQKIDTLIAEKEKELLLLDELKQSEIAYVVTKGLNPNVTMKDSGISWIGQIPEHWEVKQLRSYLRMVSIKNHPDEQLLSVVREQGVIIRNTESKEENHNFIPDDLSGYKFVRKGQFVINKMKSWQGSYGVSSYDGIVSPAYYVCDLNFPQKEFFNIAIRSKFYVPFFTQYSKGIRVGQWDLSPIGLKSIPFIEPPLDEMDAIVEYIKDKTKKIEILVSELQSEIEYLKELKQRLVADAVTGQIKVC